ncbi:hypothetical protein V7S43_016196 [Phytophthora oleae]|uniref:Uncharacterized protein n=1 Tax=Phytophthora oleae TaxID=2107226 RepID=A0ABD3EWD2_9STRA
MWHRDVSSFPNLDFNRFCCSIFYFVEMWVQEITQDAYDKIFSIIRSILADHFPPMPSSVDSPDSTFKPTLESFDDAFDRERDMESMNLNIGKSIIFDANKYFQYFGSPTATIQATNVNLLLLQEWPARTPSRVPKSGGSNPKLLRPVSSPQSRLSIYNSHNISPNRPPPASPPRTTRPFLLAGATALKAPTTM